MLVQRLLPWDVLLTSSPDECLALILQSAAWQGRLKLSSDRPYDFHDLVVQITHPVRLSRRRPPPTLRSRTTRHDKVGGLKESALKKTRFFGTHATQIAAAGPPARAAVPRRPPQTPADSPHNAPTPEQHTQPHDGSGDSIKGKSPAQISSVTSHSRSLSRHVSRPRWRSDTLRCEAPITTKPNAFVVS